MAASRLVLLALAALAAASPQGTKKTSVSDRQRPVLPFTPTSNAATTTTSSDEERSTWDNCKCGPGINCVCVMYYLCDPTTNTVYTYGEDVLDERELPVDKCPGTLQQCCRVPDELLDSVGGGGGGNGGSGGSGSTGGVETNPPVQGPSRPPRPPPSRPPPVTPCTPPSFPFSIEMPNRPTATPAPPLLPPPDESENVAGVPNRGGSSRWECGVRRTDFALLDSWARVDDRASDEVSFAEFPWTLILLRADEDRQLGGASLIHPKLALTAAHTVHGMAASDLRVRAGEWDAAVRDEPLPFQERPVEAVHVHPAFVRRALFNDAALLVLQTPFEAAPHVSPICLPPPTASFDGRRCIATGWGADAPDKDSSLRRRMKRVDLPVMPRTQCEARLRTTRLGLFFHLHESFMCAGAESGRDTCKGDGGGPLVCQSAEDPRRYEQAGIVSWGIGCADPEVPAVYTDVSKLRPWIDEHMRTLAP